MPRNSPDLDKSSALLKAGWKEHPELRHQWRWSKPPLTALYTLLDAWDLQSSLKFKKVVEVKAAPVKA